MPAYMIFIREGEILDPAAMATYRNSNRANVADHEMKPLVVYGDMEILEGEAPDGVVLLEFPSAEHARAWYHSPEYQASAAHRKRAANYRVILVEGV